MDLQATLDHLEEHGYAVVPTFLEHDTTAAIRAHIDGLAGPVAPLDDADAKRVHVFRHPIPGEIMIELATRPQLLELAMSLLRIRQRRDLRMLEQVLIRTDPKPPPHGPGGWHVDFVFRPDDYHSTPRRTYYHMVHACSTVPPGGGAFMIVPGSHRLTYAAAGRTTNPEELAALKNDPATVAGIDLNRAIEVCPQDGDLLIFNPMCLHSASGNATDRPRYVYFASFADASAKRLWDHMTETHYRDKILETLRARLPAEHQELVAT